MFHFPYYENDEGTYMSQAWSLLKDGQLAPYTYWYDHAPGGWIFIALWTLLTGGFFTFGLSVDSGRVFMLLLHIASTFFLYKFTKKTTGKTLVATIAVIFFSLSPLGIYYQRRVLLDNIMTFWTFFSLFLLTNTASKLRYIILSAITFGIAVLSKENAIFFVPAFLYYIFIKSPRHHRIFALISWLTIMGLVVSLYFIFAVLRNELFPVGFLGDTTQHVSLISTLQEQLSRGTTYPFWNSRSDFYASLLTWLNKDSFIIIAGALGTVLSIIGSLKQQSFRLPTFLAALFWVFLIRGKLVIDFYIVPLLPLLGVEIGLIIEWVIATLTAKLKVLYVPLAILAIAGIGMYYWFHQIGQYTQDETTPQKEAVQWIKKNLPENAYIIIDDFMYVDLHERRFPEDKIFQHADWAWKIERDPSITLKHDDQDWTKTVYITLSHEITKQIRVLSFPYIKKALDNAVLIMDWNGGTAFRDIPKYISTNGDWMSIYKVKSKDTIVLDGSWKFYKSYFIHSYGQVIDPQTQKTTSEGQSYALLRAVWENDKDTFSGVWSWTRDHFQYRTEDKLFSWQAAGNTDFKLIDSATASDADEDIALALVFASQKWHNKQYLADAKTIISDIWRQEVVRVNGRYYLMSGNGGTRPDGYLVNPSYLSPAAYRIFATIDTTHPWNQLANDSYVLLNQLAGRNNQLPPNWILVKKETGAIASPAAYISDNYINDYGYDAFRTFWRVALDAKWYDNSDAKAYLKRYRAFFTKQINQTPIPAIITTNGQPAVNYEGLSISAGGLAVLTITDPSAAQGFAAKTIEKTYNFDDGYWKDKDNYYDQNWAWFATALYTNNLPNLFETEK